MNERIRQDKINEYLARAIKAESEGKIEWAELMFRRAARYEALTDAEAILEQTLIAQRLTEHQADRRS